MDMPSNCIWSVYVVEFNTDVFVVSFLFVFFFCSVNYLRLKDTCTHFPFCYFWTRSALNTFNFTGQDNFCTKFKEKKNLCTTSHLYKGYNVYHIKYSWGDIVFALSLHINICDCQPIALRFRAIS